jgi:hypothetical protein
LKSLEWRKESRIDISSTKQILKKLNNIVKNFNTLINKPDTGGISLSEYRSVRNRLFIKVDFPKPDSPERLNYVTTIYIKWTIYELCHNKIKHIFGHHACLKLGHLGVILGWTSTQGLKIIEENYLYIEMVRHIAFCIEPECMRLS